MTALLASVRCLDEARLVAAAGAEWIDLKEPAAGALGAVSPATVADVVEAYAATHRISATIGDCWDTPAVIPSRVGAMRAAGAQYVKVGAYAAGAAPALLDALATACAAGARVIVVCFAEHPPHKDDIQRLAATGIVGVMLDTAVKEGPRLPELLPPDALSDFVCAARSRGLLTGLAGRLRAEDVRPLLHARPDYLGFRGALCRDDARTGHVDAARVTALRRLIASEETGLEENPNGMA